MFYITINSILYIYVSWPWIIITYVIAIEDIVYNHGRQLKYNKYLDILKSKNDIEAVHNIEGS